MHPEKEACAIRPASGPFDMAWIPPGWFWMGSGDHHASEAPRRRVFTDGYAIAATPVTRKAYLRFLDSTHHPEPREWKDPLFAHPDYPVVGVSWFDAVAYCRWVSALHGRSFRLPTEA